MKSAAIDRFGPPSVLKPLTKLLASAFIWHTM